MSYYLVYCRKRKGASCLSDNLHKDHRKRMKEQFRQHGAERFNSHQLLELLLFYGIPQKDTNLLAHQLITKFGNLTNVFNASFDDLCRIKGISEHTAILLRLCGQLLPRCYSEKQERTPLTTQTALVEFLRPHFINQPKEKLVLLCLNNRQEPLDCSVVSQGSLTATEASVREVLERVIRSKATAVVLAHNHPAGHPVPSTEDLAFTKSLSFALKVMEVALVDHLIFSEKEYLSIRQQPRFAPMFSPALINLDASLDSM